MSVQSNVPGLVAHWRTVTGGYNSSAERLTDYSGFGNHLYKLAGTPDFTQTKASYTGFKMHGDCYFGSDSTGTKQFQLPQAFTMICVLHTNLKSSEAFFPFYANRRTYASTNDPEWAAPTDAFTDNAATALMVPRLLSTTARFGDLTFGSADASFTNNQWNVFTCVLDPFQNGLRKIIVNNGTPVSTTVTSQQRQMMFFDEFRLGHFAGGTITTSGGESLTATQFILYTGDATQEDGFDALINALIADPTA